MPEYTVPRFDEAPLAFEGELLASVSGQHTRPGKTNNRWHEIDLFKTQSGKYVVAIRFCCATQHDDPYEDAEVFTTPQESLAFLHDYDPVENVRGWPLAKNADNDRRLREALVGNFERLVAQIVATCPTLFAERI